MQRFNGVCIMFILFFTVVTAIAGDTGKSRDKINDRYKWDLTQLFKTNDDWQAGKTELEGKIKEIGKYKGTLANSADQLYQCLEESFNIQKEFTLLYEYARDLSDQDTRESGPMGMSQEMQQIGTKLSAATAYIDPEILTIEKSTIEKFLKEKPELKDYAHYIDNIQRLKPHTRSAEVEEVISQAGIMSDTPYDIYGIFKNADMPRPEIELTDGKKVSLDDAAYTLYRADDNRDMRIKVFEDFFGAYKQYERTFGTQLYGEVKKDIFYKNVQNYKSCVESALDANNIPVEVYTNLIKSVHENLPTLYRYLNLRKKMLGIDELRYFDMYPSLVKEVDLNYTIDQAEDLIKDALKPMGNDYLATLNKAFNNRWIDVYPNTGKRSGAYSTGSAYDVHPYILMNFNGKYEDVSTLAHELGHTMHSYYSNKNQTYANSNYPIFLAEVASTCNEALLADYVLNHIKDPQKRLSLLGSQLETFRTTLFRQTQFAEFELKIHEMAEKGEALTGDKLTKLYLDILKTYYGNDKGVTVIDDLYGIEWAYIPHFYYNFYVFQYATSLCASNAISEKILDKNSDMRDKYVKEFLSKGRSEYAIPILKNIGVDMTTTEPYELAFKKMNKIMDEIEEILAK